MPTIIYVDDSRDDLFYLDYIRRKQQIDVDLFCFSTAETALAALEQRAAEGWALPELLVADLYMVTAKPRTGPEPKKNRMAAAIRAVILPSMMVE